MPFELHWEPQGVLRLYMGRVTAAQRRRSFNLICADPRFDDLRYTISDYRQATHYDISPEDTEEIAALHIAPLRTNPRVVLAAVTQDARITAAIEHFIALKFISQPYRIFASQADARRWIAQQTGLTGLPGGPGAG